MEQEMTQTPNMRECLQRVAPRPSGRLHHHASEEVLARVAPNPRAGRLLSLELRCLAP